MLGRRSPVFSAPGGEGRGAMAGLTTTTTAAALLLLLLAAVVWVPRVHVAAVAVSSHEQLQLVAEDWGAVGSSSSRSPSGASGAAAVVRGEAMAGSSSSHLAAAALADDDDDDEEEETEEVTAVNMKADTGTHHRHVKEGDLVDDDDSQEDDTTTAGKNGTWMGGICPTCRVWPRRGDHHEVAYVVDAGTAYRDVDKERLRWVFDFFAYFTNVRFVERTDEADYVNISSADGCWSRLGMRGGVQPLSLQKKLCTRRKTITHELLHTLGLGHEHQRPDRGGHIRILEENICKGYEKQMQVNRTNDIEITKYDYASVTHYKRSVHACPTGAVSMTADTEEANRVIDTNKMTLSSCDINEVFEMYRGPVLPPQCIPGQLPKVCTFTDHCLSDTNGDNEACTRSCDAACASFLINIWKPRCRLLSFDEMAAHYGVPLRRDFTATNATLQGNTTLATQVTAAEAATTEAVDTEAVDTEAVEAASTAALEEKPHESSGPPPLSAGSAVLCGCWLLLLLLGGSVA